MKKIFASLLIMFVFINTTCFAESKLYDDLNKYKIMVGDENGNINPDNNATYGQVIKMVVVMLGYDEIAKEYKLSENCGGFNIPDEHWAKGYINFALDNNLITISDKDSFDADKEITDVDILRYLISALGYNELAQSRGGNIDSAYVACAKKIGLLEGIDLVDNKAVPRSIVANIVYNSLDIPLMKQTGFGGDVSYSIMDGKYYPLETLRINLEK